MNAATNRQASPVPVVPDGPGRIAPGQRVACLPGSLPAREGGSGGGVLVSIGPKTSVVDVYGGARRRISNELLHPQAGPTVSLARQARGLRTATASGRGWLPGWSWLGWTTAEHVAYQQGHRQLPTPPPAPDRLVIVACGARKTPAHEAPAGQMYTGSYHRAARRAADTIAASVPGTRVMILSAMYGLVDLHEPILRYDLRLGHRLAITAQGLREQAEQLGLLDTAEVVVLAPTAYADLATHVWPHAHRPLAGTRGIGDQMARLKALAIGERAIAAAPDSGDDPPATATTATGRPAAAGADRADTATRPPTPVRVRPVRRRPPPGLAVAATSGRGAPCRPRGQPLRGSAATTPNPTTRSTTHGGEAVDKNMQVAGGYRFRAARVNDLQDGDLFSLDDGRTWHIASGYQSAPVSVWASYEGTRLVRIPAEPEQEVVVLDRREPAREPVTPFAVPGPDEIEVAGPDQQCPLWMWEEPNGRHALLLGDSWDGRIAYCGTLRELTEFAARIQAALEAAGRRQRDGATAQDSASSRTYTVLGVWDGDQPVPVGVVDGDHQVTGGAEEHWEQGLWAIGITAADPAEAQTAAGAEMRANR